MTDMINSVINSIADISYKFSLDDLRTVINEIINQEEQKRQQAIEESWELPTLTPKEVQQRLNISSTTLWRWEKAGYLTPTRIGGKKLYKTNDIQQLLK